MTILDHQAAGELLDEMSDHAAALLRAAAALTAVPDDRLAPWLRDGLIETYRDTAAKLDEWRAEALAEHVKAQRMQRALDEVVLDVQEQAGQAERAARARQPEAGPFRRAWNEPMPSLRRIDDVIAAAHGDSRVIPLRPRLRAIEQTNEGKSEI